jgi:hypothetical protein
MRVMNELILPKRLADTNLNPIKIFLLFLTGVLLGVAMISAGWAASSTTSTKKHTASKPAVTKKSTAHKKPVAKAKAQPAPLAKSRMYLHPGGLYAVRYPASWEINAKDNAMVMRSQARNGAHAVFGVVHRSESPSNEESVKHEFEAADKPGDLIRGEARVAGHHAIKVTGTSKDDPLSRMVEYYVDSANGHQYYILMKAPREDWNRYNMAFSAMIRSLSLN